MSEQLLAVGGILQALLFGIGATAVDIAIHEVVDDFNVIANVELAHGAVAQVVRNCRYAVALLDGEAGDRQIGAVETDQCDVSPMQGSDERQFAAPRLRRQHLPGQQRTHGMRNRIVHMQQIQVVELGDFSHPRGQGEIIGREIKKRITRNVHLVVADIGMRARSAG